MHSVFANSEQILQQLCKAMLIKGKMQICGRYKKMPMNRSN